MEEKERIGGDESISGGEYLAEILDQIQSVLDRNANRLQGEDGKSKL